MLFYHMKTAVIYARFSCDKQREASIDDQVRVCREYAERMGYQIVKVYSDYALSGRTDERPQFQLMIAEAGISDFVIVYMMDRFSRDEYDAPIYKKALACKGVKVLSALENIPDSPEGVIYEKLLEGMAACESIKNSIRTKNAMTGNALECLYNGDRVFGYSVDPVTKKYVINEAEARIVREVYHRYINGETINSIAATLRARGITTTTGKPANYGFVHRMLHNEKYTGVYIWGDIRIPGGMPRIIDDATYLKAQGVIVKKNRAKEDWEEYLLTGKLVCSLCGHSMVGFSARNHKGDKYCYYGCPRKAKCDRKQIRKELLESAVAKAIRGVVASEKEARRIAALVAEFAASGESATRKKEIEKRLADIKKSNENLLAAIEQGVIPSGAKERIQELSEAERAARADLASIEMQLQTFSEDDLVEFLMQLPKIGDDKLIINAFANQVYLFEDYAVVVLNYHADTADKKELAEVRFALGEFEQYSNGSPGRIRTYNPPVNSRMLCR